MPDLEELRRVLRAREALAPEPDGIAAAARARGTRIRRVRVASAVAGSAAAVVTVIALGAGVLGSPQAGPPAVGPDPAATVTGPVRGGWPTEPLYTAPAVPGSPVAPGPTQVPTAPASGRAVDPVVPFTVDVPDGWREAGWWCEEGSFRATLAGPDSTVQLAVIDVLDPATQPASLLRPSGDPAAGTPGADGTLAWLADPRHFVRVQLQGGQPPGMLRDIAGTLRFAERTMIAPFRLTHLPAGLHLSGAGVTFASRRSDPEGRTSWQVTLSFDYGNGPARPSHDLQIGLVDNLGGAQPQDVPGRDWRTIGGRRAYVLPIPEQRATLTQVFGVHGTDPFFLVGDAARSRIPVEEIVRIVDGLTFVAHPEDTTAWIPLQTP